MGYALFASRKIMYTNLVNTLQMKLDNIMMQKQSLLTFSANISDGQITAEEVANDLTNLTNYNDYNTAYASYDPYTQDANGNIISLRDYTQQQAELASANMDDETAAAYIQSQMYSAEKSIADSFSKQYTKKLEALENQLDLEQERIESQLTVAEKQLEAVEEAEGKAIDRATPKYNGVG